jgi:hypothetical protein
MRHKRPEKYYNYLFAAYKMFLLKMFYQDPPHHLQIHNSLHLLQYFQIWIAVIIKNRLFLSAPYPYFYKNEGMVILKWGISPL